MDQLKKTLEKLKNFGCCGIKVSFEDEGALLNEIITMRYLTSFLNLELSIKIGGCEAKRDIVDCININCDSIVAPMVESNFALSKFKESLEKYNYKNKKGFNLETIDAYNNILTKNIDIDFVVFGRVDFVNSLNKTRSFVESNEIYTIVENTFEKIKKENIKCYLGGAITINSKSFISKLIENKLLDKFETRYIIYDVNLIDMNKFEELINIANQFELLWLQFINDRYTLLANKDLNRIKMIEDRINKNII